MREQNGGAGTGKEWENNERYAMMEADIMGIVIN